MRLLPLLLLAPALGCAGKPPSSVTPRAAPRFLYVWAGDIAEKSSDFLAVVDLRRDSPTFARILRTVPIGVTGTMPHHAEDPLPGGQPFFANGYRAGRTFLFDDADPLQPRLAGEAERVPGLRLAHSFSRVPNGHVLATFQYGDGAQPGDPGGLAEFDAEGHLLRSASSADSAFPRAAIRTYSLAIAPALDRALTTSQPMARDTTADVVQLWRLSDLQLLRTIPLPQRAGVPWQRPYEPRLLGDGHTVVFNTYTCGLYRLRLDEPDPSPRRVYDLDSGNACGVPVVVGRWYIVPITRRHLLLVLDVADPDHPREAFRLGTGDDVWPHWTTADRQSGLVEVTGVPVRGAGGRILLARLDERSGRLRWVDDFRDPGSARPGISFAREDWPDGHLGPAAPHAAMFAR